MEKPKRRSVRTSPSLHLMAIVVIFGMAIIGYLAIIWAGNLRGFSPSKIAAARDLAFFLPIVAVFFWLTRRQRYRGEMVLVTVSVFLFAFGLLMQYRLFSDREYGAGASERTAARRAKAQAMQLQSIKTGYDDEKKRLLFGDPANVPEGSAVPARAADEYGLSDALTSVNTYIPLAALFAMAICFRTFRNDAILLWLQRHALIIGAATLIPFGVVVLMFSEEGKFLGQTTPWEAVKILFLVSFAGMLADSYRHLRRTRWGLPTARHLVPFTALAAMPIVPFFALSDFGQMLVFFGVYLMLYVIAVRQKPQLVYALVVVALCFGMFSLTSKATTGFGLPARVYFRFYQWTHTWEPPPPDTWWWKRDYERYLNSKALTASTVTDEDVRQRNSEAWSDKVFQQSQGLFGIYEGGVTGEGLGLGFPETIPISDSDFIYAAIGEETGLAGSLALVIAIGVFVLAGTAISIGANDMFTKLLAAGFTAFVGFQAVVNMGGVLRLLPMTGITLPFVSHGGWSLITSFAMLGILLAISHRNALPPQTVEAEVPVFAPVR